MSNKQKGVHALISFKGTDLTYPKGHIERERRRTSSFQGKAYKTVFNHFVK